jgi:PAS domain-containing protein
VNDFAEFWKFERASARRPEKTEYITIEPGEDFLSLQVQLLYAIERSVIATDLGGIVIYWNRFAEQLYGWSSAEAMDCDIM